MALSTAPAALPLRDPAHPIEPDPQLARLRAEQPVVRVQHRDVDGTLREVWLVTRYADVRALLGGPATSNVVHDATGMGTQPGFLLTMDPPDHTRLRRLLTREFSVKRITALRPRVEEVVAGFLDEMEQAGPPADLMQAFALPVPSFVICELLGVPYADRAGFQRRSDAIVAPGADPAEAVRAVEESHVYMRDLVAVHRRRPGDDILGMLIREHAADVTDDELVGIGDLLLIAGHETTANTIGLGTLLLLQHPDQLAAVRDDPAVLRTAVEEILRYLSIVNNGTLRLVTQDITLGGRTLRAGDHVLVSLPSANRDTDLLADADAFDVTRAPGPHLTFGHGIHQCLGQQLARMEMAVALPALFRRFPDLTLAVPESELRFRSDAAVNGVTRLPLSW